MTETTERAIADALAEVHGRKTRGETPDVLSFRDRLGESHAEFVELLEVESMLDDLLEPPAPESFPRDFGSYRLLRQLGRGAIGVVYEGVHRTLHRKAAIKVLRTGFDSDPQARERFRREAFATAQVRHDHIVEIFDAGEVDGSPYYAMALVEGRSLASLIKAREVPPVKDLCREMAGIADALDALHRSGHGIVHRDVKPSNIMVRPDGRMLLADFGLARAQDGLSLTRSGDALGTPLYMSPEQMLGRREEVDATTDVYALGATLYEAVAGRPVYSATEMGELATMVVDEKRRPEPLRRVAPSCPAKVEQIVMKALEKRKGDRYPSAAEMSNDLKAFAEGRSKDVTGKPVGAVLRILRWGRSPTGLSVAAGALVAVGAAVWWTHRPAMLSLKSLPEGAEILVAGRAEGRAPQELSLAPGRYEVVLRADGFDDRRETLSLGAASNNTFEWALTPKPDHPEAALRLFGAAGLPKLPYDVPGTMRSDTDSPPLLFLAPRGDVGLADIDRIQFEMGPSFDLSEGAKLEVRRGGDEQPLWQSDEAFDSNKPRAAVEFPSKAREKLRVHDVVTYGVWMRRKGANEKPRQYTATFRIVDVDPAPAVAALKARLKGLSEEAVGEAEVRLLLSLGLSSKALERADALADVHRDSLALQLLARRAYVDLKLKEASRMVELTKRITAFPVELRDRFAVAEPTGSPTGH